MKEFLNDFKAFAFKGNMMDLAIGMIIGAAFTALVNSVVSNLFMPISACSQAVLISATCTCH